MELNGSIDQMTDQEFDSSPEAMSRLEALEEQILCTKPLTGVGKAVQTWISWVRENPVGP